MTYYHGPITYPTTGLSIFMPPKFLCPVHGEVFAVFQSTHPDDKEIYCMRCMFDKMKEFGVSTVTEVKNT